jgi:hypothetical protein
MIIEATDKHVKEVMADARLRDYAGNNEIATVSDLNKGRGFVWALVKGSKRGGTTLAVGGIRELWERTGEIWMFATDMVYSAPVELTRTLRGALRRADENGFIRVQCAIAVDFLESQTWIERHGFNMEAMLEKYVDGRNYFMYARLNNG